MDFETFKALIKDYLELGRSVDKLLAEYGYPPEIRLNAEDFIKALKIVAAAADCDINALIELTGLNTIDFARKFVKPYSTMLKWTAKGQCPSSDAIYIGFIMVTELENAEEN